MFIVKGRTLGKSTPTSVRSLMRARVQKMQRRHLLRSTVIALKPRHPIIHGIPRGQAAVFCSTVNYFKAPV